MFVKIDRDASKDTYLPLTYTDYEIKYTPHSAIGIRDESTRLFTYAPYYVMDDFLSSSMVGELNQILNKLDDTTINGSVIGYDEKAAGQHKLRNSNIRFLNSDIEGFEEFNKIDQYILKRFSEINKNIFNLDITHYMSPQYTIYDVDQYFNWHPDGPMGVMDRRGLNCIPDDLVWRKLSLSLLLNDETEYKGGDFQILNPSASPDCNAVSTIRAGAGTAIIFPAYSAHRVTPITEGVRKSLVHWFCGPRWK